MENTAWLESIVEYGHLILSLVYLDLSLDAIPLRNNQPSRLLIKCTSVVQTKDVVEPRCPRSPWYLPTNVLWRQLVRLAGILGPFQLDLQSLHANLETVHRLDRRLRARRIVIRYETKAFTHVRVLIYENFGGYDIAEGQKGRNEVCIAKFLR